MSTTSSQQCSIVAGGAGFIGRTLVEELLSQGRRVVVIDNFSRGRREHLSAFLSRHELTIIQADLSSRSQCEAAFESATGSYSVDEVWHLAANSDIPAGVENPDIDFKDTFQTTYELLRSMRRHGIGIFNFASSSAIYGDLGATTLREDIGPLFPISNYGAMKLASEAQASAAAEGFLNRLNIFRFPNVVGVPATHGVILDFVNKLAKTPEVLHVLGDGTQQKSYLHVSDLVAAMMVVRAKQADAKIEVVNIGPCDEGVTVKWIAEQVVARVSPGARIAFGSGNRGWVGDVPKFIYSTTRIQSYGWSPAMGSEAAILRAIDQIALQQKL
jgi:UDP-glucose 4-epimerase